MQPRGSARLGWLRTALAVAALHAAGITIAHAQSAQKPTLSVAATITAEPASQIALAIRVGPADAVPRNSFVRLRGLPTMAALSEGHSIAPGAWAVSLAALPSLKVTLPAAGTGRSEITVALIAVDGTVLAEQKAVLNVVASAQPPAGAPPTASILRAGVAPEAKNPIPEVLPRPPSPSAPSMTPEARERAMRLMKKGNEQLEEANISAARLFYERAADAGLAEAAMALAATYDAAELPRLNVRGVRSDPNEAKRWYERARQLGAADADQRLRRLGAN
jgi:hypothetical protein